MTPAERLYMKRDRKRGITKLEPRRVRRRHRKRYARAIALAGRDGGLWLDVGCGSGYGTAMAAERADWAIGIDRDHKAVAYALEHYGGGDVRFRVVDVGDIAQGAPPYDVVLAVEVLEHLSRGDQRKFVSDAARILTITGTLVVCCPIGDGPGERNPWHLHEPTCGELASMLDNWFRSYTIETEAYMSTSGPALQAYAVAKGPR